MEICHATLFNAAYQLFFVKRLKMKLIDKFGSIYGHFDIRTNDISLVKPFDETIQVRRPVNDDADDNDHVYPLSMDISTPTIRHTTENMNSNLLFEM